MLTKISNMSNMTDEDVLKIYASEIVNLYTVQFKIDNVCKKLLSNVYGFKTANDDKKMKHIDSIVNKLAEHKYMHSDVYRSAMMIKLFKNISKQHLQLTPNDILFTNIEDICININSMSKDIEGTIHTLLTIKVNIFYDIQACIKNIYVIYHSIFNENDILNNIIRDIGFYIAFIKFHNDLEKPVKMLKDAVYDLYTKNDYKEYKSIFNMFKYDTISSKLITEIKKNLK